MSAQTPSLLTLLWQKEIEDDSKKEHHCHAVVGKDGAHNLREDGKHACCLREAKTYREGETDDDHVTFENPLRAIMPKPA